MPTRCQSNTNKFLNKTNIENKFLNKTYIENIFWKAVQELIPLKDFLQYKNYDKEISYIPISNGGLILKYKVCKKTNW